jgi:hypothetical protein
MPTPALPELLNLTEFLIKTTGADGVIVLVLAGQESPYYSAQLSENLPTQTLNSTVDLLRELASEIAKGIEERQAS